MTGPDREKIKKEYFVCFDHVHTGLSLLDTLYGSDYILYAPRPHEKIIKEHYPNYETQGINIQSITVKVAVDEKDANDFVRAHIEALRRCNEITAYLAGIYQVSFFFTLVHTVFNYQVYDKDPVSYWTKLQSIEPLVDGKNTLYSIGRLVKHCKLIRELPNFNDYKKYEDLFYLWRSAEDIFNELGWRFLNYIRIIEFITKKQRGGENKARIMYESLGEEAQKVVTKKEFVNIITKWGNPVAHGNIKNAVIPRTPRDYFNQDPETMKLSEITRSLIKDTLSKLKTNE